MLKIALPLLLAASVASAASAADSPMVALAKSANRKAPKAPVITNDKLAESKGRISSGSTPAAPAPQAVAPATAKPEQKKDGVPPVVEAPKQKDLPNTARNVEPLSTARNAEPASSSRSIDPPSGARYVAPGATAATTAPASTARTVEGQTSRPPQ